MRNEFKLTHYSLLLLVIFAFLLLINSFFKIGYNPKAYAAINIDFQASANGATTWSHTVGVHANSILLVGGSGNVTAVTYNGTPLTLLSSQTNNGAQASIWYLKNPPTGVHTITRTGGVNAGSVTLYNIDLTNTFGTVGGGGGQLNNSVAGNTTLNAPELCQTNASTQICFDTLHVFSQVGGPPNSITEGSSQTLLWKTATNVFSGASVTPYTGTGLFGWTPMNWTLNSPFGNYGWIGLAVPLNTVAAAPTATPTPTSVLYTISGNVFNDVNKDGIQQVGELAYPGVPNVTASRGTVTNGPNGVYTITNLTAGQVTVSYNSLPAGYNMTYPLNGPPPSFQVTVGPGCTVNGAKNASCP